MKHTSPLLYKDATMIYGIFKEWFGSADSLSQVTSRRWKSTRMQPQMAAEPWLWSLLVLNTVKQRAFFERLTPCAWASWARIT